MPRNSGSQGRKNDPPKKVKTGGKKGAKDTCLICKKPTDLKKDSVACNVCELQFHATCKGVSEDALDLMQRVMQLESAHNPYRCESCDTILGRLDDRVKKNTADIARMADRVEEHDERFEQQEEKIKNMKEEIKELKNKSSKNEKQSSAQISKQVQSELAEQNSRSKNLVFHGIPESDPFSEEEEKSKIKELLEYLNVSGEIKWIRRLAAWRANAVNKPLLASFSRTNDKETILEAAHKLSKSTRDDWKKVKIVPDLTPAQRDAGESLRKECIEKNNSRSEEERAGNLIYKVVGLKGSQQIKRFTLRENEALYKGKVLSQEVVNRIKNQERKEDNKAEETQNHSTPKDKGQKGRRFSIAEGTVRNNINKIESRRSSFSAKDLNAGEGTSGEGIKRKLTEINLSPSGSPPLKDARSGDNTEEMESENEKSPPARGGSNPLLL